MRDSQYRSCAAQNQFTAYLLAAIRNYERTYLKKYTDSPVEEPVGKEIDYGRSLPCSLQIRSVRQEELYSGDKFFWN